MKKRRENARQSYIGHFPYEGIDLVYDTLIIIVFIALYLLS